MRSTGHYEITGVSGEEVRAFIPRPLPPMRPKLNLEQDLGIQLRTAENAITELNLASQMVPSLAWFVYVFVRKEAVVSSQIEGTQASLGDLLSAEAQVPVAAAADHVEEICNYLDALEYARAELDRPDGLPLSVRLLNGAHERLMDGVRGQGKLPGQLRRSQNLIGGTRPGNARYVPPPPGRVTELLGDLEAWLNSGDPLPPLVRAGLAHVQFETIHPYLDGNGRIGRLLIALCLQDWQILAEPVLYLSLFFKRHQREYYARLDAVRTEGDWEGWLAYFLEGVEVIARESVGMIQVLFDLVARDRTRYLDSRQATVTGSRLFEFLPERPVITVKSAATLCDTTRPTASKAIDSLCAVGILEETSGRQRDRVYRYRRYMDLLGEGTEVS